MADVFETIMMVMFGLSWPMSIVRSYKSRTSKGKSPVFLCLIISGYLFGIAAKFITNRVNYVLIAYIINVIMVSIDLLLYFRNRKLDAQREMSESK